MVREHTYLGIAFDGKDSGKEKRDCIFKANQWWGRFGAISKFSSNKYEVTRGILKGIALSGLLYDSETLNWTKEDMNKLEVIQNKVGRIGLGANRMVGTEAMRGDMGWTSFEERIFKRTLRFKIRLGK